MPALSPGTMPLSPLRIISMRPSLFNVHNRTMRGRDFWSWGETAKQTDGTSKAGDVYDFTSKKFTDRGSMAGRDNSYSLTLNDDIAKADIEKMEIKKKIHDIMQVLNQETPGKNGRRGKKS